MVHRALSTIVLFLTVFGKPAVGSYSNGRPDDLDNCRFEGVVRDSVGAAILNASVTAQHDGTARQITALTDENGRYRIIVTEPGLYSISIRAGGFRQEERTSLAVVSGRTLTIDFVLEPAGVSEQVIVRAESAPLIDTNRTVVGDTITLAELNSFPLIDRDPLRMVFLMGGVAEPPLATSDLAEEGKGVFVRSAPEEAGLFSTAGSPAASNNITIDGMDNNDDRTARERAVVAPESIAEVQVITNQYAAEFGRASGGRINIRTRGGTNEFRGEFYAFFADEALNANTFFRNARGAGRVPLHQTREGGTFAGPLVDNKHFFFGQYERFDVEDFTEIRAFLPLEQNPLFPLPSPNHQPAAGSEVALFSEEFATPETRNFANVRFDLNLTERHTATVRSDLVRGSNRRAFPGGARLPETALSEERDSSSLSFSDYLILSSDLTNQARFQFSRLAPRRRADSKTPEVIIEGPSRVVAGGFTGSSASPAFSRSEERFQLQDNLSFSTHRHLVKIGGDVQFIRTRFNDLFATGGQFTFETVADFLSNRPSQFVQRFNTESRLSNNVLGFYAQDEWKLTPGLTFSYGVRWDGESLVDDRNNFSPRLSLAWDPFAGSLLRRLGLNGTRGDTVVRLGFGIFYNRALVRTIDDFSLGKNSVTVDSDVTPELLSLVRFPAPMNDPSVVERLGIRETEFLRRTDKALQIPYTIQTGLGVERKLGRNLVFGADYVFTRAIHLWRETNINSPALPAGFQNLSAFLVSRDFDNRPDANGVRPIASVNADVVRFDFGTATSSSPGAIRTEHGLSIMTLGLNAPRSGNIRAALNAVRFLRPDPSLTQVEQLEATGNSFYHGGIFTVRYSLGSLGHLRAAYTLSKFIDEGTTNTASAQELGDRRAERALSLQDQRHRINLSGLFHVPFLNLDLAPIVSFGSSRPFNIGSGVDRNLNDIENDRPLILQSAERPGWHRPGDVTDKTAAALRQALVLAPIGSNGDLPRNYGRGPGTRTFDLRASRTFNINERVKIRPAIDAFNVLNATVFSFGAEFIDRDEPDFLVARRTQRPRVVHLSLKVFF